MNNDELRQAYGDPDHWRVDHSTPSWDDFVRQQGVDWLDKDRNYKQD